MRARLSECILACDTTQGACSAGIWRGDQPLASRTEPMMRGHAEAIIPMIDAVMAEANVAMDDITRLGVTIGPGTFTGVRLGLAAMRAIAIARALPLIGVSSFWAMAQADITGLPVTICVAARSGVFYMQNFEVAPCADAKAAPQIIAQDDVADFCPPTPFAVVGSGASALAAVLSHAQISPAPAWPDIARVAQYTRTAPLPDALPEPIYLRPPDATLPDPSRQISRHV